ncbi:MAG: methionine--tRNA ligase [Sulfolobaceae archaeon]
MKILVASAWPYVNSVPHLGNLIGSMLSADVFARYARLKYGRENVIFVSGSDEHGTPIEIEAIKRKVDPKQLTDQAHEYDKTLFTKVWEIEIDNYSRTESEVHKDFVRKFLLDIKDYIRVEEEELPYCEYDKIFLPDRFVRGQCPYCGFEDARGDQCDNCGRLLSPKMLINPKCAICNNKPKLRVTKHWFFDLSKFSDKIRKWIEDSQMPENVKNYTLSWIEEGLKPRSITRDNKWGIPAPFEGAEEKTIYVWFEALLGYISATIEYFKLIGKEDKWKEFWFGSDVKSYYFIGKDNIPFHTIILPAMLLATGKNYTLPTMVCSTEYLLYEGQKFSKSRKIGIWIDEAPKIMDVEYWRYVLIRLRPEERDTSFTWREAIRIVNNELNDDIGNYANRVLVMIKRNYQGKIPSTNLQLLKEEDKKFMEIIKEAPKRMGELFEKGKLKAGSEEILKVAREGNLYLNIRKPWDLIHTSREEAGNVLNIAANSLRTISIMLFPIMPRHAQLLYSMLGLDDIGQENWDSASEFKLKGGESIGEIRPLFTKLPLEFESNINDLLEKVRKEVEKNRPSLLK